MSLTSSWLVWGERVDVPVGKTGGSAYEGLKDLKLAEVVHGASLFCLSEADEQAIKHKEKAITNCNILLVPPECLRDLASMHC
jgi:hypothetical protein